MEDVQDSEEFIKRNVHADVTLSSTKNSKTEEVDATELIPVQKNVANLENKDTVLDKQGNIDNISKQGVIRTLLAVSISFMIIFSAFDSFSNLQSTLNTSGGLGTIGLALIYVFMIITSLFVSTLTLSRYHAKWIVVFSMLTYIVYMATGFYPSWSTIIPASAVIGVVFVTMKDKHDLEEFCEFTDECGDILPGCSSDKTVEDFSTIIELLPANDRADIDGCKPQTSTVDTLLPANDRADIEWCKPQTSTVDTLLPANDRADIDECKPQTSTIDTDGTLNSISFIETGGTLNNMSKQNVILTLTAVGVSFMLTLSAFDSFSNLQSTLNTSGGLGTIGLALICVTMIITSMFLATLTVSHFDAKKIMACSLSTFIVYISTGFYPTWCTIIPASVVIGVGASHLWLAVVIYITSIATRYATLTKTKEQDRVNLFLGIFFGFMYTSQIWGNLISSLVFQRSSNNSTNFTRDDCGSTFCASSAENSTVFILPTNKQVNTFTGICIGLGTAAVGVLAVFAATVKTGTQRQQSVLKTLKQVTKHLTTSRNQQLLLLPSVFAGLWNGFAVGDFTMAYISCPYGIENVGFVMITFGVGQSFCSVIFGKLSQYTGHFVIYVIGFLAMMGALVTLLLWTPDKQGFYVVFILALLIGMGVAVNNPIVISYYNLYMSENLETAHSTYRLLNSLGWAIAFGYSSVLCTNYKIYILVCILVVSMICITVLNCQRKVT